MAFNTALVQSEAWRSQTEDFLDHWVTEEKADAGFAVDKEEWQLTLAGADNALNNMSGSPNLQVMQAKVIENATILCRYYRGWLSEPKWFQSR